MAENTPGEEAQTFEQRVNEIAGKFIKDEKGSLSLPEGLEVEEHILFAAKAEKRRRDTQSEYTKSQQRLRELEAENNTILEQWQKDVISKLSEEQKDELEQLKHEDPDKWRAKLNELETTNKKSFEQQVEEIKTKTKDSTELERRKQIYDAFLEANPGLEIDDEVIENEIPPKYSKQLEKGEIAFEDFLNKCKDFLLANKVVAKPEDDLEGKTFDDVGGTAKPPEEEIKKQSSSDYINETY